MKLSVIVGLIVLAMFALPAVAAPVYHGVKPSFPVASRLPLPLRRVLFIKFMDAIQKADDDAEKKYPTPLGYVKDRTQYNRYIDVRTAYVNKLTERYTGKLRRSYGVSSHEEDLIEYEGAQMEWPN